MKNMVNPDFVIVGSARGPAEGVILMASTTLTYMELQEQMREYDSIMQWNGSAVRSGLPPHEVTRLNAVMRDYVVVTGATYAEAWQRLFDTLSPPTCPKTGDGPWSDERSRSAIQAHYLFNHEPLPPDQYRNLSALKFNMAEQIQREIYQPPSFHPQGHISGGSA